MVINVATMIGTIFIVVAILGAAASGT